MFHIISQQRDAATVQDGKGGSPSKSVLLYILPASSYLSFSFCHRWCCRGKIMDSLTAHCDKSRHCWVMWSYQLFVFNVQDRSSHSNKRIPLSLFSPLKINSDLQFHRYRMGYWARFWNKIQFFSQILLQMNHASIFIPSLCSSPAFLFECYGRVKLMNTFFFLKENITRSGSGKLKL